MPQPVIETERLFLRELTHEDARALAAVLCDPGSMQYYSSPFDLPRVHEWIEGAIHSYRTFGYGLWAVVLKADGQCIGDCGITHQQIDGEWFHEIGYHINPKFCSRGYATEAALAVREYGFSALGMNRLVSYMHSDNRPSRRVAEKVGMKHVKSFEKMGVPQVLYGIAKDIEPTV